MKNLKYFYGSISIIATLGAILVCCCLNKSVETIYTIVILAILEISLSFDNAIINAKVIAQLPILWQKLFIYTGLPIAVFGMRMIFPILLVSISSHMSFIDVISLAIQSPDRYKEVLEKMMDYIYSFGGAFLLMLFLNFFFKQDKNYHWIPAIENNFLIRKIKNYNTGYILFAIIVAFLVISFSAKNIQGSVAISFILGIITHEIIRLLIVIFESKDLDTAKFTNHVLLGFIYLEILDASFSFDCVVAAFAISTNIIIIMIGLSIGAIFVRSLTIFFVNNKTLSQYRYIEHGAYYAVGFLAIILLLKNFINIPEWFSGLLGVIILLISFIHSVYMNRLKKLN